MQRIVTLIMSLISLAWGLHAEELFFRNISWTGRHVSSTVRALYKGQSGFCWLGADSHLVRFDGSHLVDFQLPTEKEGVFYITSLGEMERRFMLVGTTKGLWRIPDKDGRNEFARIFESDIPSVGCIEVIDSVTVAIGSSSGLHIYDYPSGKLRSVHFDRQRLSPGNRVLAMTREGGVVFTVTGAGIFIVDLRTLKYKSLLSDPTMGDATSVAYGDGRLFVGSLTSGLGVYDAATGKKTATVDVGCNVVTSLSKPDFGPLFAGTDGNGISVIDCGSLEVKDRLVKKTSSGGILTSNQVYSVLACGRGDLWVGYYQGAADYSLHLTDNFKIFEIPGLIDTHGLTIRTINLSDRGLMLGTRTGLYYISSDRRTMRHVGFPRLRSDMVLAVHQSGGLYYIGTYGGGCMVYDPTADTLGDITADGGGSVFGKGHIFSIDSDRDGTIWFGTSEGLIAYKDGKILHRYNDSNSKLPDNNVYEIFFDTSGKGWVGTNGGMAIIDSSTKKLRTDLFPEGFIQSRSVRYIYEDLGGALYFVSEKGPMTVSNLDMTEFHDVDPELFNNAEIRSVIEDNDRLMWVTTNNGIFRWDKDHVSKRFGFADGVINPAFISGNLVKTPDGEIWLGNPDGLLSFNPAGIDEPADNSPIAITGVTVDDRFVDEMYFSPGDDGHYRLELDSKPHILKVDFTDFLYSKPETTNYEYSTDGVTWKKSSSEMSFIIYDLTPGHNTVMIRNTRNKGNGIKLEVKIPYPVSYWFLPGALALAAVGAGIWVMMRRRRRRDYIKDEEASMEIQDEVPDSLVGKDSVSGMPLNEESEDSDVLKEEPDASESKIKKKYGTRKFSDADRREIESRLQQVMDGQKPYLDPDLSVADLGEMLGVSSHRLSQYFSQCLTQSFYDFVNGYRVEEFKRLVAYEKTRTFTLTALSEKAGFSSRSTFFRYFKKLEGITPAEYIQNLG